MSLETILDLLILAVLALGGLAWRTIQTGVEQATRNAVTEAFNERAWPAVLARELEKSRGTERQELRFQSYGQLWAKMRRLAMYDDTPITHQTARDLSTELSSWYFSPTGGLMLTAHNRALYFTLQDVLRKSASREPWQAERVDDPGERFIRLLTDRNLTTALALRTRLDDQVKPWPPDDIQTVADGWRIEIGILAGDWTALSDSDRFVVLQQVSSALRTGLTRDVDSRLR